MLPLACFAQCLRKAGESFYTSGSAINSVGPPIETREVNLQLIQDCSNCL